MGFVWKLMLSYKFLSRLAIAAVAVTICVRIHALQVPSFDSVVSRIFGAGNIFHWFAVHRDGGTGDICLIDHYFGFLYIEFHSLCAL